MKVEEETTYFSKSFRNMPVSKKIFSADFSFVRKNTIVKKNTE